MNRIFNFARGLVIDLIDKGYLSENAALKYGLEFPDAKKAEEFSKMMVKIGHSFMTLRHLFSQIGTGYLKESDSWDTVFKDLKKCLIDLIVYLGTVEDKIGIKGISVPEVENIMDMAHSVFASINASVKMTSGGLVPDWFLKSNASDGYTLNFRIQAAYWMSARVIKRFYEVIDGIRSNGNDLKPNQPYVNLMANLPEEVETQLREKSFIAEAIREAKLKLGEI